MTESTGWSDRLYSRIGTIPEKKTMLSINLDVISKPVPIQLGWNSISMNWLLQNIGRISEEQTDINPMKCQIWNYVDLQNKTC